MKVWIAAALAAATLVVVAPQARADDNDYLELLQGDQFYSRLGSSVLLAEGRKICNAIANGTSEDSAASMVERDLSVSPFAAGEIVGAATDGLGC